mgnify:FL=1|jgi:hypothetical protein|tara:strand:+ start:3520 stop:3849 length:330 start_codon:yes stop_codon:yes gene_type:complete
MGTRFASSQKALGVCDVCGFTYRLRELRNLVRKNRDTNIKACPECWSPDNPQLNLGETPVHDPQALQDPRPDSNQFAASRAQIIPVRSAEDSGGTVGTGFVGQVTVQIT